MSGTALAVADAPDESAALTKGTTSTVATSNSRNVPSGETDFIVKDPGLKALRTLSDT
ncbi:hypothetical protein PFUM301598_16970 [Pseudomonas fluorescens]